MKTKTPSILVVGSMNMDLVVGVDRMPEAGESYFGKDYHYIPGGKGANQAVAAAKLGANLQFVGRVGDDAHGEKLISNLVEQGIDINGIIRDPDHPSGLAIIVLEPTGQNRIFVYPGSNMHIRVEDVENALNREFDAILLNFEIADDILFYILKRAKEKSVPVFIDAGPARTVDLQNLGPLEILSPNETETETLTGLSCDSIDAAARAAAKLAEIAGAKIVVIKLGARGALLWRDGIWKHFDTLPAERVDATAAGDAFTAAMTVNYLMYHDLGKAVQYGNAAGALAITQLGAQPSLPTEKQLARFIADSES